VKNVPGSAVIQGVDEEERHGAGHTTGHDVLGELLVLRGILGGLEHCLDGVLECEVERLCGEVTEYVGHVT